ncbi:MAG: hypothetical protein DRN01_04895 [Thermoplasmata archaeon]|nr:MAG: hypothetical protein DRN01_04895 [Thermoplasmata archaeon]
MSKMFLDAKEKALRLLNEAKSLGEFDEKALAVVETLNSNPHFFTTSSCSGRVVVVEIPKVGLKREACFLGRWHDSVGVDDVKEALDKAKNGFIWFIAQPPIFHVVVDDIEYAERLVKAGLSSGFKNSAIRSIGKKVVVELSSTERFDVPLGKDHVVFCNDDYLVLLCGIANDLLKRGWGKLVSLEKVVFKMSKNSVGRG